MDALLHENAATGFDFEALEPGRSEQLGNKVNDVSRLLAPGSDARSP